MPITRKLSRRPDGTYRLTIPRSWVELAKKRTGKEIEIVYMEVDRIIKIALDPEHLE